MRKVPLKQCIGCQEVKNKKEMIRVIKITENEIMLSATGRKNDRGAYLCPSMECLKKTMESKGLDRSFEIPIPKEVYETLEEEVGELGK